MKRQKEHAHTHTTKTKIKSKIKTKHTAVVGVVDVYEMIFFFHGTARTNAGSVRNLHGRGSGSSAARADVTLQSKPAESDKRNAYFAIFTSK